jgi:uncharacterized protein YcbX
MPARVTELARYPIKGLSLERLLSARLQPGRGFEGDRAFALALPDTVFDEDHPIALPKTRFLVLARQEALAGLSTKYDATNGMLRIDDGDRTFEASTRTRSGIASINEFFVRFLPAGARDGQPRLVRGVGHRFTDVGVHSGELMNAISVLNLESVRDFEEKMGVPIDPRRFRMNILIDGLRPWEDMDWIGREITIGQVKFRGVRLTVRCPATEVNPETALRDISLPRELKRLYGHVYLGLYLQAQSEGSLAIGDKVAG